MDISLERRFLSSFRIIGESKKVCDISSDIVVPDTKEDILRVVLTNAQYRIRSKDVESGKVTVHGEVKVNAVYVPESGAGLCTLSTDIPFECEFEVESADSGCAAVAELNIISLDTRILNPRKILISAQLCVSQKCYCNSDFTWYTEPAESIKNAFFKTGTADVRLVNLVTEKTFSIEDELPVQNLDEAAQLVSTEASFYTDSAEAVGSKLIVKGHADIKTVYYSNGNLENADTTVSFSQIFELPERDIMPVFAAVILPTGDYFELTDGRLSFEIHAVMQIVCTETKSIDYVEDAYVCSAVTELKTEEKSVCVSERRVQLNETVQLNHNADNDIERIIHISGQTGMPKLSGNELTVPLTVELIYSSFDGQLRSLKVHDSASISIEIDENEVTSDVSAHISAMRANANGSDVTISATVSIDAVAQTRSELRMVSAAEYNELENGKELPSIYMCRAESNDLWSIAKRYNSDIAVITKLNELDETCDMTNRLLVVPRIK